MTPQEYCQDKTASSGSSFYYSFLFLNTETRRAITALYAFCREVDDVVDNCREPAVAQQKLDWWRNEISTAFENKAHHPVAVELQRLIPVHQLDETLFQEIINGMQMDLVQSSYPDFDVLSQYCYRAASVVGLLSARLFGYQDEATETYAHDLGMAFQLTNIIRDVREDAERGRVYLPQDMMRSYDVTNEMLSKNHTTPELQSLLADLADKAEQFYQTAMQALPNNDRWNQRSGLIMSAIYHRILERIRQNNFNVMQGRTSLPTLSKIWIAWRTARAENKRYREHQKYQSSNAA